MDTTTPSENETKPNKINCKYPFDNIVYTIDIEIEEDSLNFTLEKDISLTKFKEKIKFENIKEKHYYYKNSEAFLNSFKKKISAKTLILEENKEKGFIALIFPEMIADEKETTKITVKKMEIIIENCTQVAYFEDLFKKVNDLEKKDAALQLSFEGLTNDNIALKDQLNKKEKEKAGKAGKDGKDESLKKLETAVSDLTLKFQKYESLFNDLQTEYSKNIYGKISESEYELINGWIHNELKNFAYRIIYKATIHGFGSKQFHFFADGITNILVLGTTEKGERFGAFTPISFNGSNSHQNDNNSQSFLFSINKKLKFKAKSTSNSIYDHTGYGPTFGSGHALHICHNSDIVASSYGNPNSEYENTTNQKLFEPSQKMKEIEVYTLRKV